MKRGLGRPRKDNNCFNCEHPKEDHPEKGCKQDACYCYRFVSIPTKNDYKSILDYLHQCRPREIVLPNYPALFGGAIAMIVGIVIMLVTLINAPEHPLDLFVTIGVVACFFSGAGVFGLGIALIALYPTIKYTGLFEKDDDD